MTAHNGPSNTVAKLEGSCWYTLFSNSYSLCSLAKGCERVSEGSWVVLNDSACPECAEHQVELLDHGLPC